MRDTGIGIPESRQAAVFESFTQADGSSSRRYGGTGLGLTICKQLVDLMGAKIWLKSAPGVGSTFFVEMCLKKQTASRSEVPRTPDQLDGVRALVVDDNPTNRLILREHLKAWGCQSAEASSGAEALELLKSASATEPYDVVLLDMQMPDMDGEETAKSIREEQSLRGIGIVLLTSMGSIGSTLQTQAMGFDATLVKPVHQSQLYNALAGILDRSSVEGGEDRKPVAVSAALEGVAILLVEDNAVNQKVATRILTRFGCVVAIAGNGRQALEALSQRSYDLVLMDCQMPEIDGYEATREIRRREVGTKRHQPVMAMTASALEGDRDKCIAAGMDGYVAKPVKPQDLLQAILPWVGRAAERLSSPAASAFEVLDGERLDEACGDDAEFLADVVAEFLGSVDTQLEAIRTAIAANDCLALASAAHGLKGATRTVGGVAAAAVCEELEICGRQGVLAGLGEIYERAVAAFVQLRKALESFQVRKAA